MGALFCDRWADPTCGEPRLSRAFISVGSVDIIEMSSSFRSQIVHLLFLHWLMVIQGKQKTLLTLRQAGFGKINLLLPAHLRLIQIRFVELPLIRRG